MPGVDELLDGFMGFWHSMGELVIDKIDRILQRRSISYDLRARTTIVLATFSTTTRTRKPITNSFWLHKI